MQRTANLFTALTALALAVAFVAGIAFQHSDRSDAAAATIAALNVGTCHTTDLDVLDEDDCNPHRNSFEFNRAGLSDAIEVETLYSTYAHDPQTADEPPRGILVDSDLLKISIRDEGRDVREGVLVVSDHSMLEAWQSAAGLSQVVIPAVPESGTQGQTGYVPPVPAVTLGGALDDAGVDTTGLAVESDFVFVQTMPGGGDTGDNPVELMSGQSGVIDILVRGDADAAAGFEFKPIAQEGDRGEMRFFGIYTPESGPASDFMELDAFLEWDEDVVSGSESEQPAASLLVNIPQGGAIELQAIHYLTSRVEVMVGGEICVPVGFAGVLDDPATMDVDETVPAKLRQVACTDDELGDEDPDPMVTDAERASDNETIRLEVSGDGLQATRNLALEETGRFTGVFEGFVRLTDADGDGAELGADDERIPGATRNNWGLVVRDAWSDLVRIGTEEGSAIIGVDNGPVRITYRDTDGTVRNFNVAIDIGPPTIDVNAPQHEGRSDDEEINFTGTVNDGESGLAEDSFALYLDHRNDADNTGSQALSLPVDGTTGAVGNVVASPNADDATIATETQYWGFDDMDESTFGVIASNLIYPNFQWSVIQSAATDDGQPVDVKGITAEDFADGASDAEFRDSITVNFEIGDDNDYDHAIDFQAVVRDTAGNIGFSDSDEAAPRYINDLGTNPNDDDRVIPNVLGIFSSHVVYIDNIDPRIFGSRTVTGFYDVDDDDEPIADRSGIMVVFDGPVDERSIDSGTFLLTLGDADREEILDVVDTSVTDELVFLRLADDLPSDAEPTLAISAGGEVRDLAGRVTRSDEPLLHEDEATNGEREITVNDGILPVFTVELSEGSGTGEGNEGPSRLTNNTIKVSIMSDEDIQGAPKVAVLCTNYVYDTAAMGTPADDLENNLEDYLEGLSGALTRQPSGTLAGGDLAYCGVGSGAPLFTPIAASALSRRGNEWEYTWRQYSADRAMLPDGAATVVVFGNDRSNYRKFDDGNIQLFNYGSANVEFRFDDDFESPLDEGSGGRVLPAPDSGVAERRPFILLDFSGEPTTVVVEELLVDGVDVTSEIGQEGQNRFLYWPASLASGEHEVEFTARDAADNTVENASFKFEITTRDPFVLSLFAGWNAISFPSDPRDTTLDSVFADSAVDRVVSWIGGDPGSWAVATKVDGVWTTSADVAPLTDVIAQYGYWVYSNEFIDISVELKAPPDRESLDVPTLRHVPTYQGWNFVGVVDQDGDQTEGRAGDNLKDGIVNLETEANAGEQDDMLVEDYLTGFAQAYRWDVITNSYQILKASDNLKIGEGIWAYFGDGIAP